MVDKIEIAWLPESEVWYAWVDAPYNPEGEGKTPEEALANLRKAVEEHWWFPPLNIKA